MVECSVQKLLFAEATPRVKAGRGTQPAPSRSSGPMAVIASGLVERSARSSTLAIAGFVMAVGATALVASVPGSPLHPVLPPGVEPSGPFRWMVDLVGLGDLRGSALVTASVAAVIASAAAFVFVVREAWRGTISLRTAVLLAVGANVSSSRCRYSCRATSTRTSRTATSQASTTRTRTCGPRSTSRATPSRSGGTEVARHAGGLRTAVHGFASVVVRLVHSIHAQVEVFRWTAIARASARSR